MKDEKFLKIKSYYSQYRQSLKSFYDQVRKNYLWYQIKQEEFKEKKKEAGVPDAKTGHIFNAIQYKHADFMDNYPHINVLPREEGDEVEAEMLSGIIPFIMDACKFKKTYSKAAYEKLINGTAVYGVFFDQSLGEYGDICIEKIDLLRLSFQPNVSDIQDSKFVFYDSFMDIDEFRAVYGDRKNIKTQGGYDEQPQTAEVVHPDEVVVVTDCYYKVCDASGDKKLHFLKFSGDELLDYTEGKEEYKNGLYAHGQYPFVVDVLHPLPDKVMGMGLVDIAKNPQAYIDKLDEIINVNAMLNGNNRYLVSDGAGMNEEEFLDLGNPIVHVSGSVNEDYAKPIKTNSLPTYIVQHRQNKILELKEIVGNRDFNQGGTAGGVTSGSAIAALQNTGDKLSRDMIQLSYYAYTELVYLVIELIREFYNEERSFRILGEGAKYKYVTYSNAGLKERVSVNLGEDFGVVENPAELFTEEELAELPEGTIERKKPVFDITLTVEKNNPYQRGQHNELILALFNMGLFVPQNLDLGIFVISNLNFDGKDKLLSQLKEMKEQQAVQTPPAPSSNEGAAVGEEMVAVPAEGAVDSVLGGGSSEEMLSVPIFN